MILMVLWFIANLFGMESRKSKNSQNAKTLKTPFLLIAEALWMEEGIHMRNRIWNQEDLAQVLVPFITHHMTTWVSSSFYVKLEVSCP